MNQISNKNSNLNFVYLQEQIKVHIVAKGIFKNSLKRKIA